MQPGRAADLRAIAGVEQPQQQVSLAQALAMQPVGAIRLLQLASITPRPGSPLEGGGHETIFDAPVELHLKVFGDSDLILMQMAIEGAENFHDQLGQSINRAKRKRDGEQDPVPEDDAA